MIGGGIGITPFLSVVAAETFANCSGRSTLTYSTPDPASAVYLTELRNRAEELSTHSLVEHYSGEEGFIDRASLENLQSRPLSEYLFMTCGPAPMMNGLKAFLTEAGVRNRQILTEDFEIR